MLHIEPLKLTQYIEPLTFNFLLILLLSKWVVAADVNLNKNTAKRPLSLQ